MKNLSKKIIAIGLISLSAFTACKKNNTIQPGETEQEKDEKNKAELIEKLMNREFTLTLITDRSSGKDLTDGSHTDFPFQIKDDTFILKNGAVISWDFGKVFIENNTIQKIDANWGLNAKADSITLSGIDEEIFRKKESSRKIYKKYRIEKVDELNLKLSTTVNGSIIDRVYKHRKI